MIENVAKMNQEQQRQIPFEPLDKHSTNVNPQLLKHCININNFLFNKDSIVDKDLTNLRSNLKLVMKYGKEFNNNIKHKRNAEIEDKIMI